ncbi:primosomal protein N' [Candidatus Vallotia lariciata]|uniref:primosomal protein N' n=1 Tax=Candidatus Vallotia laricis TaxID=2018052 RepID=UPI001D0316F3|nr:primosomal protein N' [Candidatus Vallotia lariciata]UDG82701.1 Primosomal protein N' [Candidatus Vallotia lariciata]
MSFCYVRVALDYPRSALYDYCWALPLQPLPGMLVQVQFRCRQTVGLVIEVVDTTNVPLNKLRDVQNACINCPPLNKELLQLISFAASYYQYSHGEVALLALPRALRDAARWPKLFAQKIIYRLTESGRDKLPDILPARATGARRLAKAFFRTELLSSADVRSLYSKAAVVLEHWKDRGWVQMQLCSAIESLKMGITHPIYEQQSTNIISSLNQGKGPNLNDEQYAAVEAIDAARSFIPYVLYGVTGSGKTEVYLHGLAALFIRQPDAQALVMVPEINLAPQFEAVLRERFSSWPSTACVTLHSSLADGERTRNWLAAHIGGARIILGTRMAVFASLPRLALIIVDEEHESAYKQQEGLCYSARDLAVWRAKQLGIPIVLGSATPSLETWWHACQRCHTTLVLSRRAVGDAVLPRVRLIDMTIEKQVGHYRSGELSLSLVQSLRDCLERGEQSLVFLNRRGYAPVLTCSACGWVINCSRCSAYLVLHKIEQRMRCHHCGGESRIPQTCPACGNVDLAPLGFGTQRIEEALSALVPNARVLRIDADNTKRKGSVNTLLSEVHAGDIDILVGTQMIAKGHNFKRVTLVGVLNSDAALFSHDFRAGERLFSQLIQVSGRAGRTGVRSEVLIQTKYVQHPLYASLERYDYVGFADAALAERRDAHLPPFVFQALLRASAHSLDNALRFLNAASAILYTIPGAECVTRYDPVPLNIVKVMHVHRAQLLLESTSRIALQRTMRIWVPQLHILKGVYRWSIEVDPLNI